MSTPRDLSRRRFANLQRRTLRRKVADRFEELSEQYEGMIEARVPDLEKLFVELESVYEGIKHVYERQANTQDGIALWLEQDEASDPKDMIQSLKGCVRLLAEFEELKLDLAGFEEEASELERPGGRYNG